MSKSKKASSITENPLAGGTFFNWLRLARESGPIERDYWGRAAYVTLMTLAWSPLRLLHRALYGGRIEKTGIKEGPLFILGHYRSGTTFLQDLICQDKQWGFVSTTQAVLPEMFLFGPIIQRLLGLFLPDKRPMDNVEMSPVFPEEPEHAVGAVSPYCFYHGFCFPRSLMKYFRRWVLFEGVTDGEINSWGDVYLRTLKAATLASGGRGLLVKNPADTARVKELLDLFPEARFIYLYRDPYVMYPSILNFYTANMNDWRLQDYEEAELRDNIFTIYFEMTERFHKDKGMIPPGSLVEVKFEDFESSPLSELEKIYSGLGLEGFKNAESAFKQYIESKSGYKKNKYALDAATEDEISRRWAEDIKRGGYGKAQ